MDQEIKRGYFSIIPAEVRYDKDLKPNAKLLYSEITALCNEKGYCWATNNYFAELYGTAKETVSRWISQLDKKGYVKIEIIKDDKTNQVIQRRIYVNVGIMGINQIINTPIDQIINTPIDQKVKENNKDKNNKNNNNNSVKDKNEVVERLWKLYPRKQGKFTESKVMKVIKEIGEDHLERCIIRYAEECRKENKEKRFILMGSTFINGRYIEYTDENYNEGKEHEKRKDIPSFNANTNQKESINHNQGYGF